MATFCAFYYNSFLLDLSHCYCSCVFFLCILDSFPDLGLLLLVPPGDSLGKNRGGPLVGHLREEDGLRTKVHSFVGSLVKDRLGDEVKCDVSQDLVNEFL